MKTVLNIKDRIFIYYSAVIFIIVLTVFSLMGFAISSYHENHLLNAHIEFYPDLINLIVDKNYEVLQSPSDRTLHSISAERLQLTINEILKIKGVSDSALISIDGEVVSTSDKNFLLKDIRDNPQFIKAVSGETGYEYSVHDGLLSLSLYIPVKSGDTITGVVYLFEGDGHLASVVHESRLIVWLVIILSGILLYLLIIWIFSLAYSRQKKIN